MTQDEIIRMACKSGLGWVAHKRLERFAALVAAHEREKFYGKDKPEECANGCPKNQVCDYCQRAEQADNSGDITNLVKAAVLAEREACAKVCDENKYFFGYQCAAAIRARGEA